MIVVVTVFISMIAVMPMIMVRVMHVRGSGKMTGRAVRSVMAVIPEFPDSANEAEAFDPD